MAGNYSANGSYVYQDDWRAEVYVTVTDLNATTCRVTVRGEWDSIYGNSSYCTGTITKNGSGGTDSGIGLTITTGGHGTIASRTFDVTRGSSTKYITCKAVVVGGGSTYSGVSSTASVNVPIPAIAYQAPEPPTGCAASRVSDSSATVSWTNGATSTVKPRTAVLIERMTDEGAWTQIASAASTATSYSDNSISANHRYAYRVRSQGNGGYSSYSTADGYVFTTPAAPSSVVLSKTAQTTIQVDVEGSAPYATGYAVELTYDGGSTWQSVESSTSLPITVNVSGGTVQFRVASLNGTLQSAWTLSETIVTICPPLAPTITARPSNPTAMGSSCTVEWLPNHPDGTSQTAAQTKITRPSGTTSTIDLTTEKSYTFTPELSGTYSVQVRTKGLDADWGAWSDSVSWGVYEPPVVVVTSPATDGTEVVALPLNVSWSVTDSTGVSTQRVIIADANGEVFNRQVDGSTFALSLTDSDVALQNETAYTITVRSMGGSGLITTVQRTFAVNWLPPVAPTLELSEGEGASTQIAIGSQTFDAAGEVLELPRSGIMTSLHIDGKSVQDGTPTPSSPVPIESVEPTSGTSISIVGAESVPIDLQGNAIRSLPDGTRDALEVDGEGNVTLTKRVGVAVIDGVNVKASGITNYSPNVRANTPLPNQATVGWDARLNTYADKFSVSSAPVNAPAQSASEYTFELYSSYSFAVIPISALSAASTTAVNEWFASNPVTVLYPLATPQTISLGTISLPYCTDTAYVDAMVTPTISASFRYADSADTPTTESVTVQRVNPDGSTWTVASNLPLGGTCIDPLPPLGVEAKYLATASAQSGATASETYGITIGGREWVLNFGNAAQETASLRYNPQISASLEQGGELYHFADGGAGGGLPVFYPTTDRDRSGSWKFDTVGKETADRIDALMDEYPAGWMRDPLGHRWRARMSYDVSHGVGRMFQIAIDWDAERMREAW